MPTNHQARIIHDITPVGRAVYPQVNTPDRKYKKEGQFQIKLALKGKPDEVGTPGYELAKYLDQIIDQYVESQIAVMNVGKFGENKITKLPRSDKPYAAEYIKNKETGERTETGDTVFKFTMRHEYVRRKDNVKVTQWPNLVDSKGNEIDRSKVTIWGGSEVRIDFSTSPWFNDAKGVGLSLQLWAVQVLKLATRDGAKRHGFSAVDGGYEAAVDEDGEAAAESGSAKTTDAEPPF